MHGALKKEVAGGQPLFFASMEAAPALAFGSGKTWESRDLSANPGSCSI
ncbi:hypothetical protein HMPREF3213_01758 [Heyndrickxia coagulans]|jgi:hypothetical protein|uniref:Uncharacterized protein n=1 Tax=Heyndrickxia coagulans TaxID=1398 RepID=A0A133KSG6_HEYCO|nr:hypothetical protein HMPREF3213_01758 [Heyndrickxia coagulans]